MPWSNEHPTKRTTPSRAIRPSPALPVHSARRTAAHIRAAATAEAARLTEIAFAAKGYWKYPDNMIALWTEDLTVSPEFIVSHDVHCATQGDDILGFYALSNVGETFELEHMWVEPAHIGSGVGAALFAHAVETVRAHGGSLLQIGSDPNAVGFYLKMGANVVGTVPSVPEGRTLPLLALVIEPTDAPSS